MPARRKEIVDIREILRLAQNGPGQIVPDHLKAAITKACWNEPEAQHAYRECAEHYDFLIAPCWPGTPQHKGKVEPVGVTEIPPPQVAAEISAKAMPSRWVEDIPGSPPSESFHLGH
jgi:hypothetical protein